MDQSLIDRIEAAVVVHGRDTSVLACNPKARELLGLSEAEMVGKQSGDPGWCFVDSSGKALAVEDYPVSRVLKTGREVRNLTAGICRSGHDEPVWVCVNADPVRDGQEDIHQVLVTFMDISQSKAIEQRLAKGEETVRALLNASTESVFLVDTDGMFLAVNDVTAARLGKASEDLLGTCSYDLLPPEVAAFRKGMIETVVRTGRPLQFEDERAGIVFHSHLYPVPDSQGRVSRIAVFGRDITALRAREERYRRLNRLNGDLLVSGYLSDKLKRIADGLVDIFDADFARIWVTGDGDICDSGCPHAGISEGPHVCRRRDKCLHLRVSSGRYTHIDGTHRRVPFGCYKIGRIASGEDAKFVTNEVTSDPRVHNHEWAKELGLKSFAGYRLLAENGNPIGVLALFRKQAISSETSELLESVAHATSHVIQACAMEEELRQERDRLREASEKIKVLSGLLPVCASCKRIRDDDGNWSEMESYISQHSEADFSHGLCPTCAERLYPEQFRQRLGTYTRLQGTRG